MTTQAQMQERRSHQVPQQPPQHNLLPVVLLVAAVVVLLSVGAIWNTLFPSGYTRLNIQPGAPQAAVAHQETPNGQLSGLVLESYTLIANPYAPNDCAGVEVYIDVFGGQEARCYTTLAVPPVSVVAFTPLGLTAEQTSAIVVRPSGVLYMHSVASRLGADAAYFHDGGNVYMAVWVAGDCTPRIFNGNGGYWQMPVAPMFSTAENVPYGPGYLINLPANWQTTWARNPAQTTAWRTCAPMVFMQRSS